MRTEPRQYDKAEYDRLLENIVLDAQMILDGKAPDPARRLETMRKDVDKALALLETTDPFR